jgi:hypothetical protein
MSDKRQFQVIFKGFGSMHPYRTRSKVLLGQEISLNNACPVRVVGMGWEEDSFVLHVAT